MTTDPWQNNKAISTASSVQLEFEDNFIPNDHLEVDCKNNLPDSKRYLESLEKKLKKLKNDPKILEQLAQKREECLKNLINNSFSLDNSYVELDAPVGGDSAVHDIYRHLYPIQPITVGETFHIINYDQLQEKDTEPTQTSENSSETASR